MSFPRPPQHIALTTDTVGGVWRYTMELAAGLRAHRILSSVVTLGPPPSARQRDEVAAADARLIVTDLPLDWTAPDVAALSDAAEMLVSIVNETGCDTTHLHAPALAMARFPMPVVAVAHSCVATWWRAVHGDAPLPRDLAWRAEATARGIEAADIVIAPTRAFADALRASYGVTRPISVVHNGRDVRATETVRDRRGILTAGRLWDAAKGIDLLDRIASRVEVPVEAAGSTASPTGERVWLSNLHALGVLDDEALGARMRASAVFASRARYEPFGLSVLEAAAAGCALVLSDIPTLRELWDGAALFAPLQDDDAWIGALREAACDATLGASARARSGHYPAEKMVGATLTLHRDAVKVAA